MYGESYFQPSHHFATHVHDQILDYGPAYGFWAFLQEQLSYVLKSFKTNNRGDGELEVTLMRSYEAAGALRNMVSIYYSSLCRITLASLS